MSISQTYQPPTNVFGARCAADIMTPNPRSLNQRATIHEAAAFFTDKQFSAAPVIDLAGRPVGVVTRTDVVRRVAEGGGNSVSICDLEQFRRRLRREGVAFSGFQIETVDRTEVGDIMTPLVYVVAPEAAIDRVVGMMIEHKVHRLFVADAAGVLVGVISTLDVLRHLKVEIVHGPSRYLHLASPVQSLVAQDGGFQRSSACPFG